MRYAALSDTGLVRRNNEDSCHADGRVFIVADGMGGHRAGEVASSSAIAAFLRFEAENRAMETPQRLREGILAANREVYELAQKDPELKGMGTTFTCALVEGGVHVGHVGDSRAYLWRQGRLSPLTRDHSLVERMVREGRITSIEARVHPQRNVILRALGIAEEVEVDLASTTVLPGDGILLCSDGLSGAVDERTMEAVLAGEEGVEARCRSLVDAANERGGQDNITVILVEFEEGDSADLPGRGAGRRLRPRGFFSRR